MSILGVVRDSSGVAVIVSMYILWFRVSYSPTVTTRRKSIIVGDYQPHDRFQGRPRRFFGCVSPVASVSPCLFLFSRSTESCALNPSTSSLAPSNSDSHIQVGSQSTQKCSTPSTVFMPISLRISHKPPGWGSPTLVHWCERVTLLPVSDFDPVSVSSSEESGDEKRRLTRRFKGGFFPAADRNFFFVGRSNAFFLLLSPWNLLSAFATLSSHSAPLSSLVKGSFLMSRRPSLIDSWTCGQDVNMRQGLWRGVVGWGVENSFFWCMVELLEGDDLSVWIHWVEHGPHPASEPTTEVGGVLSELHFPPCSLSCSSEIELLLVWMLLPLPISHSVSWMSPPCRSALLLSQISNSSSSNSICSSAGRQHDVAVTYRADRATFAFTPSRFGTVTFFPIVLHNRTKPFNWHSCQVCTTLICSLWLLHLLDAE